MNYYKDIVEYTLKDVLKIGWRVVHYTKKRYRKS